MRISLPSGTAAEIALPAGVATRGVVVAPDIFGLRPLFDDLVARLAADEQWAVIAVEPFPTHPHLQDVDARFAAVATLDDERVIGDLLAGADHLVEAAGVPAESVAVLGFCMGGMYALKAASNRRFDRAVAFYGMIRIPLAWRGPGQDEPLELFERFGAIPTLAIVGGLDPYTPRDDVAALGGVPHVQVAEYPDAEHGFVHDPSRPSHRQADAADAWSRVRTFLA